MQPKVFDVYFLAMLCVGFLLKKKIKDEYKRKENKEIERN